MPDISKINALDIGSVSKVDGLAKASILDIDGVTVSQAVSAPAVAYSVRLLGSGVGVPTYTGSCMRVREDGTNTETDIGFDVNGDLDVAAIASHCGFNNGFIRWWYDQSGNAVDAGQATAINQPQIYNGTAVFTENGKPIIKNNPSGSSKNSLLISSQSFTTDNWAFSVNLVDQDFSAFLEGNDGNYYLGLAQDGATTSPYNNVSSVVLYKDGTSWTPTTRDDWHTDLLNNQSLIVANWSSAPWIRFTLGYDASSVVHINCMQEFLLWTSNQSTNRTGIQNNINGHFQIY